ncbi:MAG: hypothetical protein ACREF7_04525 [Candidatus Saccharimonadales bacterium]
MASHDKVKSVSISSVKSNRTVVMRQSLVVWISIVIILLGLSFWAGLLYGNAIHNSASNPSASDDALTRHRYAVGLVVYISQTSITISNEENSSNQTFAVSSTTLISINGTKSSSDQIKQGNIVLIEVDKNSPNKASVILVNSHFSG